MSFAEFGFGLQDDVRIRKEEAVLNYSFYTPVF